MLHATYTEVRKTSLMPNTVTYRKLSANICGLFSEFLHIKNFPLSQGPARKGINYKNMILGIFWIASLLMLEYLG